eukprot:CAMPEP_0119548388 /NCGR_PEP_ID=MMETSP1352-20130426/2328_1 /TAXON_ID=265584 /ORGANISM="Stauroneis constricta, Strain CCMP1120" /LENGTH=35 /DNA_ID= /DNA_START= /DNA_END= /DNA_ORIENTATION=
MSRMGEGMERILSVHRSDGLYVVLDLALHSRRQTD